MRFQLSQRQVDKNSMHESDFNQTKVAGGRISCLFLAFFWLQASGEHPEDSLQAP
jgi:hypothetical protein